LDDDGLLWRGERWIAIPVRQVALVALLVRRLGRLVPMQELVAAYDDDAGPRSTRSVSTALWRLRNRLPALDLQLHTIRGRGMILVTCP
jgi:DNA-binding response OmpR family regulator